MRELDQVINELWRKGQRMPPITRRQEPPRPQQAAPTGSLLSTAIPVTSLKEEKFNACFYGRNRSGKTTIAAEIAKASGGKSLFISAEPDANGGADSISNIPNIDIIRVKPGTVKPSKEDPPGTVYGSDKVVLLANELATQNYYSWVILDTITSLQDVIYVELLGLSKVPDQMNWGIPPDGLYQNRSEKVRAMTRPLLDLKNCNVIILAQEKDHNADDDRGGKRKILRGQRGEMQQGSFMAPSLGSTTSQWLCDSCKYVIQIYENELMQEVVVPQVNPDGTQGTVTTYIGTGKRQRHLRLLYHPNFAAGGRWQFDPNMPEFVTAPTPRELCKALVKYIPSLKV